MRDKRRGRIDFAWFLAGITVLSAAPSVAQVSDVATDPVQSPSEESASGANFSGEDSDGAKTDERSSERRFVPPGDESSHYRAETLKTGLNNPCGLTIRAGDAAQGPHELFLSESGAGRVVQLATNQLDHVTEVVVGFPRSTYGNGPAHEIGPLGLAFIDLSASKLAVGTGGLPDGQEVVQVYKLNEESTPLKYGDFDHQVGPIPPKNDAVTGEGNFFGLAANDSALFVTANGDDQQSWVLKADIAKNELNDLRTFIATHKDAGVAGPVGIVINPKPNYGYLVVSHMGDSRGLRDSQLTFYSPHSGKLALSLPLGLFDAVALAYSPAGYLYAADFAWNDDSAGGVYRIDEIQVDGRLQTCQPVLIAAIAHPTSLAFAPDGALYVTSFGADDPVEGESTSRGELLRITGVTGDL